MIYRDAVPPEIYVEVARQIEQSALVAEKAGDDTYRAPPIYARVAAAT